MVTTFVLTLPCGCPASYVHADDMVQAAQILLGEKPPTWTRGCRFVPVAGAAATHLLESIKAARDKRRECRGFHNKTAAT